MDNLFKKTTLAGLGLLSYSREKAEEIAKELVEKGELSKSEESEFVKKMMERAEKDKEEVEKKVGELVEKNLHKMNIPTRKEFEELKQEIQNLSGKSSSKNKQEKQE